MTTVRTAVLIDRSADDVWKVVTDAGTISECFPVVEESEMTDDNHRAVVLQGGVKLFEEIVTNDSDLRRFQYRVVSGDLALTHHLGTIDVHDVEGRSPVVYSCDFTPAEFTDLFVNGTEGALTGLAENRRVPHRRTRHHRRVAGQHDEAVRRQPGSMGPHARRPEPYSLDDPGGRPDRFGSPVVHPRHHP